MGALPPREAGTPLPRRSGEGSGTVPRRPLEHPPSTLPPPHHSLPVSGATWGWAGEGEQPTGVRRPPDAPRADSSRASKTYPRRPNPSHIPHPPPPLQPHPSPLPGLRPCRAPPLLSFSFFSLLLFSSFIFFVFFFCVLGILCVFLGLFFGLYFRALNRRFPPTLPFSSPRLLLQTKSDSVPSRARLSGPRVQKGKRPKSSREFPNPGSAGACP